jgi:hypothetical protein
LEFCGDFSSDVHGIRPGAAKLQGAAAAVLNKPGVFRLVTGLAVTRQALFFTIETPYQETGRMSTGEAEGFSFGFTRSGPGLRSTGGQ